MSLLSELPRIGGTLVWYYLICQREVWFMSRGIDPNHEDEFLVLGRLIDQKSYKKEKHSIEFGSCKFDIIKEVNGTLIIGEVKKSSRSLEVAKIQLAHYLYELDKIGINAHGELLFPKEKRKEVVYLTNDIKNQLDNIYTAIKNIAFQESPPPLKKNHYCRNCAYKDFYWG